MTTLERIDYYARVLKYRFKLNPVEIARLPAWLERGAVALDVGAHKGGMLYWLRRRVGIAGAVYAFEPQPALARYLGDVVRTLRWHNVTVEHAAVGSVDGPIRLFVPGGPGGTSPAASVLPKPSGDQQELTVPGLTLDRYFPASDGRRVAFIKCDVEGNELEVFRGAEQLLRRDRPTLVFECETRHLRGTRPEDVFAFLQALGYRGQFFSRHGLRPVEEFSAEVHQRAGEGHFWGAPGYVNDFLFQVT